VTRERSAAIGYQGQDKPRRNTTPAGLNKTPYFFSVLECVLGLHDHPAGEHPMPLSQQEFFAQQRPQRTKASTPPETTEYVSLAGKYARFVKR